MPTVATVRVPADEFTLGQVLADVGDYYAELTQFVPTDGQFVPYVWVEHEDPARVEASLRTEPRVSRVTKFDERVGRALYEIRWDRPHDDFIWTLMEGEFLLSEGWGTPACWEFELLASDSDELAAFQADCRENGVPIEIRAVHPSGASSVGPHEITDRQRDILSLAHERGYFDQPRGVTVSELASELDISPHAASRLLRRGLANLVEQSLRNG